MRIFVLIVSALLNGCSSAAPVPLVPVYTFNQQVIIYGLDGTERSFTREFTCSFDEALYQGGDWNFYFERNDVWVLNGNDYSPVTEEQSASRYKNGAIHLGSTPDHKTLHFYMGGCIEFMGLNGESRLTPERDIIAEGGPPSYDVLSGREYWHEWGIADVKFTSDTTILNSASSN